MCRKRPAVMWWSDVYKRQVLVIDGKVGFTGGVNLADEYINHVEKFGRWKDAAVMLEGEAVRSLTAIFLQMWDIAREPEFEAYLKQPIPAPAGAKGFAAPYGDCPLDGDVYKRQACSFGECCFYRRLVPDNRVCVG